MHRSRSSRSRKHIDTSELDNQPTAPLLLAPSRRAFAAELGGVLDPGLPRLPGRRTSGERTSDRSHADIEPPAVVSRHAGAVIAARQRECTKAMTPPASRRTGGAGQHMHQKGRACADAKHAADARHAFGSGCLFRAARRPASAARRTWGCPSRWPRPSPWRPCSPCTRGRGRCPPCSRCCRSRRR